MIHDVIIVWGGAAGLFTWINLDKNLNKLILEKTDKLWTKVLLSGWERANVSNMDIEPERDYFSQNKKFLLSIFSRYNQWDIMSFFAWIWVNVIEEDRWRLILESWDSKELLNALLNETKKNNCEIKLNQDVLNIEKKDEVFEIKTRDNKKYLTKNVVVSSWWKSFFQVWTTGEWYSIEEKLWINVIAPYRSLCWLTTKKDLKELSGSSMDLGLSLVDNKIVVYKEFWPLLFTHFGISWPIVFNTSTALWEYLNSIWIKTEQEKIKYILENIKVELDINKDNATKKIYKFFKQELENEEIISFWLQDWRSWKEAKATGWWVDTNELDNTMQSKKHKWLYFVWELVDVTGKTGGFNLQWAWSSAYVCREGINRKKS
jgi:predicted Rossmann fold flavoprotein